MCLFSSSTSVNSYVPIQPIQLQTMAFNNKQATLQPQIVQIDSQNQVKNQLTIKMCICTFEIFWDDHEKR